MLLLLAVAAFEVLGSVEPKGDASAVLHGATTPFVMTAKSFPGGEFHFSKVPQGIYTLAVSVGGRGDAQTTIEVGPKTADAKGRVRVTISVDPTRDSTEPHHTVSARSLAVPAKAAKAYAEADRRLAKRDIAGAVEELRRAVEIFPKFSAAWNHLGTIAYQTKKYTESAEYFRTALAADPGSFEPLVNLGGVSINLAKLDDAYQFNLRAVLRRPNNALANAQLGMTYFALGKPELAEKYLKEARRLDPGHFSNPQLILAEIAARRGDRAGAATWLEEFLRYHPDWPAAEGVQERSS